MTERQFYRHCNKCSHVSLPSFGSDGGAIKCMVNSLKIDDAQFYYNTALTLGSTGGKELFMNDGVKPPQECPYILEIMLCDDE